MERMYHIHLIIENKENTANRFNEFKKEYRNICPANGDIKYAKGRVRCILHSKDEDSGNGKDDSDGSVPFL
ncbi:MAG: hypothetical protein PHG06_16420 [Parabacteroides sp.]|nr:hypothetical protein [Parabacteroides sp.]